MGLAFCWADSDRLNNIGRTASRYYFNRQVIWNGLGLSAFVMATIVGWRRWLRSAPFVFAGWVILWFAAHMKEFVAGSSTIVLIGPISLEVWSLFPVALALLVAWLRQRYGGKARRILFSIGIVAFVAITVHVATNANRMTHLAAFFAGERVPTMSPAHVRAGSSRARHARRSLNLNGFRQLMRRSFVTLPEIRPIRCRLRLRSCLESGSCRLWRDCSSSWRSDLFGSGVLSKTAQRRRSSWSSDWESQSLPHLAFANVLGLRRWRTCAYRLSQVTRRQFWRHGLVWAFSFRLSLMQVNSADCVRAICNVQRMSHE